MAQISQGVGVAQLRGALIDVLNLHQFAVAAAVVPALEDNFAANRRAALVINER